MKSGVFASFALMWNWPRLIFFDPEDLVRCFQDFGGIDLLQHKNFWCMDRFEGLPWEGKRVPPLFLGQICPLARAPVLKSMFSHISGHLDTPDWLEAQSTPSPACGWSLGVDVPEKKNNDGRAPVWTDARWFSLKIEFDDWNSWGSWAEVLWSVYLPPNLPVGHLNTMNTKKFWDSSDI